MSYEPVVLPLGETVSLCRSHSLTASGDGAGTGCWDRQVYEGIALVYSPWPPTAKSKLRRAAPISKDSEASAGSASAGPTNRENPPGPSELHARWRASLCRHRTGLPAHHPRLPAAPAGRASGPRLRLSSGPSGRGLALALARVRYGRVCVLLAACSAVCRSADGLLRCTSHATPFVVSELYQVPSTITVLQAYACAIDPVRCTNVLRFCYRCTHRSQTKSSKMFKLSEIILISLFLNIFFISLNHPAFPFLFLP